MTPEERAAAILAAASCPEIAYEAAPFDAAKLEAMIAAAIRKAVDEETEACAALLDAYAVEQ